MKHTPFIFVFFLLLLTACQESSTKKSSSSSSNYCALYPYSSQCLGSTTGGTNQTCYTGNNYWCMQGCPGYGQNTSYCSGTTTGGSTSGTTNPPTNTCPTCPTTNIGGWTGKYPGGVPTGSCTSAYAQSGISYTPYETRKATMTIVGKTFYSPASGVSYMNTSSILQTVAKAKTLFETDSILKVRFKVRQQPESSNSSPYCTGRQSGSAIAGYTQLQFNVQLVGLAANGSIAGTEPLGTFTKGVNDCTDGIDLTSYASQYPGGIYLIVQSVKGNQAYFPNDYEQNGFKNVTGFVDIRSQDCWVVDVEVAADGTKTFD